jgi:SHS2 domain-containing protein
VRRGYRQLDHTADLALELTGPSQEEVLLAGAEAVIDIMTEGAPVVEAAERTVAIDAVDEGDRLVQWLNEIVVAAVCDGFLFASGDIELVGATGLRARLRGEAGAGAKVVAELKSATYHDLALDHDQDGWRARVVIDV